MSEDFLNNMAASSRERSRIAQAKLPQADLLGQATATADPPRLVANPGGFDLIAEVKLRSPAAGLLKPGDENVGSRVSSYAAAGAAAISVLTEPTRFDGSMDHLRLAAQALEPLHVPAMRKDFLVDPYQVIEARAAGAGGVLIILRMLSRQDIEAMIEQALELNLFALLEAFDEQDIELAYALTEQYGRRGQRIELLVGVNCRDLVTLKVVPGRLEALAHLLPVSVPRVAESGVGNGEDARRVAAAGYDLALVGSALMTASSPHSLVGEMLAGGRAGHTEYESRPHAELHATASSGTPRGA
ncbi:MAG: indole-3-glycerol-phosphate synthase [Gammaproteobacteria bacterium]